MPSNSSSLREGAAGVLIEQVVAAREVTDHLCLENLLVVEQVRNLL